MTTVATAKVDPHRQFFSVQNCGANLVLRGERVESRRLNRNAPCRTSYNDVTKGARSRLAVDIAQEHSVRSTAGIRKEWPLAASVVTLALLFWLFSKTWFEHLSNPFCFAGLFGWLFISILLSAFAIVGHAEAMAERVGVSRLGTLILTLAVTGLEVMMIAAVMYGGQGKALHNRTNAMFAVLMLVLNGMIGVSLVVGGMRYREQTYNLMGANAFLALIVPLSVLGLVLPNYTISAPGPVFSPIQAIFEIVMSIGLYGIFLAIQTVRHRGYFVGEEPAGTESHHHASGSPVFHMTMLLAYLLPVVILAKKLAVPINHAVDVLHAPPALGGLLVAVLILSPSHSLPCGPPRRISCSDPSTSCSARAGDHRPDDPRGAGHRLHDAPDHRAGGEPNRHAAPGAARWPSACSPSPARAPTCLLGGGAYAVVPGVRDIDF